MAWRIRPEWGGGHRDEELEKHGVTDPLGRCDREGLAVARCGCYWVAVHCGSAGVHMEATVGWWD